MQRRLIKQGGGGYTIYLPKKWIDSRQLKEGDEVDIKEGEEGLEISIHRKDSKKQGEISITYNSETLIRAALTNAYRKGYDRIAVNFKNPESLKYISNTIRNYLIGFEIIKKSANSCIIENITEPSDEQFDNIFSKVFLNIEELTACLEKKFNLEKSEEFTDEYRIMQFYNFCRRVISKRSGINSSLELNFHSTLVHSQRELYFILRHLEKNKIEKDMHIIKLLEGYKKCYELLKKAYYEKDLHSIELIHLLEKEFIYKKGYDALKKSENQVIIYHLLCSIRHIYLATSPLIGMII